MKKLINGEFIPVPERKKLRQRVLKKQKELQETIDALNAEIEKQHETCDELQVEIHANHATIKNLENEIAITSKRRNYIVAIEMRFNILKAQLQSTLPSGIEIGTIPGALNHLYRLAESTEQTPLEKRISDLQGALRVAYQQIETFEQTETRLDHAIQLVRGCCEYAPEDLRQEIRSFLSSPTLPCQYPQGDDSSEQITNIACLPDSMTCANINDKVPSCDCSGQSQAIPPQSTPSSPDGFPDQDGDTVTDPMSDSSNGDPDLSCPSV